MTAEALQERMRALRGAFVEALSNDIPELARAIGEGDHEAALVVAHRVAGRAGTFGFPEVSDCASDLERLLTIGGDPSQLGAAMTTFEHVGADAIASARG